MINSLKVNVYLIVHTAHTPGIYSSLTVSAYFSSTSFIIMANISLINADRSAFNIAERDQTNYNITIYPPPVAG
jgi:hypothetical protein